MTTAAERYDDGAMDPGEFRTLLGHFPAGSFCVNILGFGQQSLVRRFALSGGDKFTGLDWRSGPSGHPILPGVPAWIDCDLVRVDDAGDHWIVLGRVRAMSANQGPAGPLVFARGKFGAFVATEPKGEDDLQTPELSSSRSWWW
jgi:flavin reductase (DIM6/NTAB) family NADH-FMN oxidoreductase RutF